jgi:carbamoyl-phosphate synthase large subunit
MVQIATDVMTMPLTGRPSPVESLHEATYPHFGVKEAVFPFNMFPEVDPILGPEMRSTGEVLGLASTFGEAFFKAQEATKTALPTGGTVLLSVCDRDKAELPKVAQGFVDAGFKLLATGGTYTALKEDGFEVEKVLKAHEGRPNLIDIITNGEVDLVVNTPSASFESNQDDSYIRKTSIKAGVPYMTTMAAAYASAVGIKTVNESGESPVRALQDIHADIK